MCARDQEGCSMHMDVQGVREGQGETVCLEVIGDQVVNGYPGRRVGLHVKCLHVSRDGHLREHTFIFLGAFFFKIANMYQIHK